MSSGLQAKPKPKWFAPSSIPPILLLTVVTSFAFNHALVSTQRKQDVRNHRVRTMLLNDTIEYNSRLLFHLNPPTPSSSWFRWSTPKPIQEAQPEWIAEERDALVRRWKALGTDPVATGLISPSSSNSHIASGAESSSSHDLGRMAVGPKQITWSEIFLGSKENRSSLSENLHKVAAGIRQSFSQLNLSTNPTHPANGQDQQLSIQEENELQQLSALWSNLSKS